MANEKRLIDANALDAQFRETKMIEIFPNWKELSSETKSELIRFGKALKEKMQNAPTVDAVEVVHGRWETVSSMGIPVVPIGRDGLEIYLCGER